MGKSVKAVGVREITVDHGRVVEYHAMAVLQPKMYEMLVHSLRV